jgi:glycosyltransferase involved in cell wall biosynthesis
MGLKKKKILLLADDVRMHSGVATQSKEIVMNTLHKYEWVQIAAAVKHPEEGRIIDLNNTVRNQTGIKDAYLKLYPISGYGNPDILRQVMEIEKPDAILHYTDPRFWLWLYAMEHEVRTEIPILYYNIWDDLPTPYYNANYYRSSDLLMAISKQTYGINKRILNKYDYEDWQITYTPHGVNEKEHYKIESGDTKLIQFENKFGLDKFDFKVLFLNRNIRRKSPGDVVMAYKYFVDQLPLEEQAKCCLIFHTQPSDENGTDLKAVCAAAIPNYNVVFTHDTQSLFNDEEMNYIYNIADVYINLASNEGFGLASLEAIMAETPIIVNVTGGLQDQCGFKKEDGTYLTADDYIELGSNHRGKYQDHGEWVKPVFPSNISLQGSPMTPYIFDDRAQFEEGGQAIKYWYDLGKEERERCGKLGREYVTGKNNNMTAKVLGENFIDAVENTFEKWKPREKYTLEVV